MYLLLSSHCFIVKLNNAKKFVTASNVDRTHCAQDLEVFIVQILSRMSGVISGSECYYNRYGSLHRDIK